VPESLWTRSVRFLRGAGQQSPRGFGPLHRSEAETRGRGPTSPARYDAEEFQWISRPSLEPLGHSVTSRPAKENPTRRSPKTLSLTVSWASAT
jgi:hypothetical protein